MMFVLLSCVLLIAAASATELEATKQEHAPHQNMRKTVPMHHAVAEHNVLFTPSSEHFDYSLHIVQENMKAKRDTQERAPTPGGGTLPVTPGDPCLDEDIVQIVHYDTPIIYSTNEFAQVNQSILANLTCRDDIVGYRWQWFKWFSPDFYGTGEVHTCGLASFDTTLLVLWSPVSQPWSNLAHSCDNLQCAQTDLNTLSFNDDYKHGKGLCSRTTFSFAPNQIYYFLVGGYDEEVDFGSFGLAFRTISESDAALLYEWREDISCAAEPQFQTPDNYRDANNENLVGVACLNWFHERDILLWEGLGASVKGLTTINLNGRRLKGPLSVRLNELQHVVWLDLSHNAFGPTVPEWAMHLTNNGFSTFVNVMLHQQSPLPYPYDNYYCALNDNAFDCCNVPDDVKVKVRRLRKDRNLTEFLRIIAQSQCFIDPKVYLSCEFPLADDEASNLADLSTRYGHQLNARGFSGWDQTLQHQVKAHWCSWNGLDALPVEFANNALINFDINGGGGTVTYNKRKRAEENVASLSEEHREVVQSLIDVQALEKKHEAAVRYESPVAYPFRVQHPSYLFPYYLHAAFVTSEVRVSSVDWRGANLPSQPLVWPSKAFTHISYCDLLGNHWHCPINVDFWDSGCFDHTESLDFYYGWEGAPCPRGFNQAQEGFFT